VQVTVLYTRAAKGSARRDKSRCWGWVGVKQGRGMEWNGINRRGNLIAILLHNGIASTRGIALSPSFDGTTRGDKGQDRC